MWDQKLNILVRFLGHALNTEHWTVKRFNHLDAKHLNTGLGVRYSNGKVVWLGRPFESWTFRTINRPFSVRFSDHNSKTGPFDNQTKIYHLNTRPVRYSDCYCIFQFALNRINYTPSVPVTHLCTANKRIILVLANKSVVRVDQSKPDASMEIVDLSKTIGPKAKINQAFLDPRGNHLILTLKSTG